MRLIQESLESMLVKCKEAPRIDGQAGPLRLRVGGFDHRKMMFKGWVDVESFSYRGHEGSFCVMQRDVVSSRSRLCFGRHSSSNLTSIAFFLGLG